MPDPQCAPQELVTGSQSTPCPDRSLTLESGHCRWSPHHPPSHMRGSWQNYEREELIFTVCLPYLPQVQCLMQVPPDPGGIIATPNGYVHLTVGIYPQDGLTSLPISRSHILHSTTHVTWIRSPSGPRLSFGNLGITQVRSDTNLTAHCLNQVENLAVNI